MTKAMGLVSANYTSGYFGALAEKRSVAAIPFGGRYRLLDFPLSNLVNAGIDEVGLITPYYYRPILDHIGAGKSWGLDKKEGGLFILPGTVYGERELGSKFLMRDLQRNWRYLELGKSDYVIIAASDKIYNMDFKPLIKYQAEHPMSVTFVYKEVSEASGRESCYIETDENGRVINMTRCTGGRNKLFVDCFIAERKMLLHFLDCYGTLEHMDLMDIIAENLEDIQVNSFEFKGYVGVADDLKGYMECSMQLLDQRIYNELFCGKRQIYTKITDETPVVYRNGSDASNSLIGAGCVIEGCVNDSVVFRSSRIERGAHVKGCVLMHHVQIGEGAVLENVILDKYVKVSEGARIKGRPDKPIVIAKGTEI